MKEVLWISRHEMTAEQLRELARVLGGPVRLRPYRDTVTDVSLLRDAVAAADAVAAVLPAELLAELLALAGDTPVLLSDARRVPTGRTVLSPEGKGEPEFAFRHDGWKRLLRLEVETRRL